MMGWNVEGVHPPLYRLQRPSTMSLYAYLRSSGYKKLASFLSHRAARNKAIFVVVGSLVGGLVVVRVWVHVSPPTY